MQLRCLFSQQVLVKFVKTRRETSLVSELHCTSPHNQTVNFLLFVFVFSLSADSVLIKRLLELY